MSALDIEGVLAAKFWNHSEEYIAHVAAVLREQIAAWLGSDEVEREIVQQANAEDDRHFAAGSSHGLGAGEAVSLTLAALAAQVAPSRVPGES